MVDLGSVTENEVVLAFLRGEIDAPRYRDAYLHALQNVCSSRAKLIDEADLSNEADDRSRADLLGCVRGYGRNAWLFTGFPDGVSWHRWEVEPLELGEFLYANVPTLLALSGASRRVSDGAKKALIVPQTFSAATQDMVRGIPPILERVEAGQRLEELIAVADSRSTNIVLLDGHTRATAFVIAQKPQRVRILMGTSARMHEWRFI